MRSLDKAVSIIIPNYNCATYLPSCINSCLDQGEVVKEIIIIDDHSTDKSWTILKDYEKKFPHLIRLYKNKGKGSCSARNYGYELSTGKYIQWLDSDDYLGINKLNTQLADLGKMPNSAISFSKTVHLYQYTNGKERRIVESGICYSSSANPPNFLLTLWGGSDLIGGTIQTNAWLVPRKIVDKAGLWNENLLRDQDGEFFTRIVLNSERIIYSEDAEAYYRKVESSLSITSTHKEDFLRSELDALNLKYLYLKTYKGHPAFVRAFAKQYLNIAVKNYSLYQDIYLEAWNKYLNLNYKVVSPQLGGKTIEVIKNIFGWKCAVKLKRVLTAGIKI